jgi:MFS family permease
VEEAPQMHDDAIAHASARAAPHPAIVDRRSWLLVWALMIVVAFNVVDRQMMSVLGASVSRDLGLSDSQLGLLGGLGFSVVYCLFGIPWGWVADRPRANRVWVISAALAIWSGATALSGAAQSFVQMLLARMGVAAGEAGCTPVAHALIAETIPRARLAFAMALFGLGIPLGAVVGRMGGGMFTDLFGWRSAFLLMGAPGVIFAILLVLVFRNVARTQPVEKGHPVLRRAVAQILRSRTLIHITLGKSLDSALASTIGFWGMMHFQRNLGLSPGEAGFWLGLQAGLTGLVGIVAGGFIADYLARQRPGRYMAPAIIGMSISPPLLILAWWTDQWWIALLLIVIPTMCNDLAYGGPAAATQRLLSSDVRASATAVISTLMTLLGSGLGLTLAGVASDVVQRFLPADAPSSESVRYVLMGCAPLFLLAAFFFWRASRNIERELAEYEAPQG